MGGRRGDVSVWDSASGQEIFPLAGHTDWVPSVAFAPDGNLLATGGQDHLVKFWDLTTHEELSFGEGHKSWVQDVSLTRDGRTAVTGSTDGTIRVWDTETGAGQMIIEGPGTGWIFSVAVSPDDKEIITGEGGGVAAYELSSGKQTWKYQSTDFCSFFSSVQFDQRNHFACLGADGAVYVFDYAQRDRKPQRITSDRKDARTSACALSPDGNLLALSTGTEMAASSEIEIWNVPGGRLLQKMKPEYGGVNYLEFSPDGERLLSTGHSTTSGFIGNRSIASPNLEDSVLLWDLSTGQIMRKYGLDPNALPSVRITNAATFSPDGRQLITAERDGSILIYAVDSGQRLAELRGHLGEANSVCIDSDGERLVSVSSDLTGLVWDVKSVLQNK
jgi:WD40 repeat protein